MTATVNSALQVSFGFFLTDSIKTEVIKTEDFGLYRPPMPSSNTSPTERRGK